MFEKIASFFIIHPLEIVCRYFAPNFVLLIFILDARHFEIIQGWIFFYEIQFLSPIKLFAYTHFKNIIFVNIENLNSLFYITLLL